MISSILRLLVQTYIAARVWDNKNFDLVSKGTSMAYTMYEKAKKMDEKYGIQQIFESIINKIQTFNKNYKVTERVEKISKSFDKKYHVTEYVNKVKTKAMENEKIKKISKMISKTTTSNNIHSTNINKRYE
eukprot:59119_1